MKILFQLVPLFVAVFRGIAADPEIPRTTLARWDFNQTNTFAPTVGTGNFKALGNVVLSFPSGAGSSDPAVSGDFSLGLARFYPAPTNGIGGGVEFSFDTGSHRPSAIELDARATGTASRRLGLEIVDSLGDSHSLGHFDFSRSGAFTNRLQFYLDPTLYSNSVPEGRWVLRVVSLVGESGSLEGVDGKYSANGSWRLDRVTVWGEPGDQVKPSEPTQAPLRWEVRNEIQDSAEARAPHTRTNDWSEVVVFIGQEWSTEVSVLTSVLDVVQLRLSEASQIPTGVRLPFSIRESLTGTNSKKSSILLKWKPEPLDAGRIWEFRVAALRGGESEEFPVRVHVPTALEGRLWATEILASPSGDPSSPEYNPFRRADPVAHSAASSDEFIEWLNTGDESIDISEWTLSDSTRIRHRFAPDSSIEPKHSLVVYGSDASGVPSIDGNFTRASEGSLGLSNSGEVLSLRTKDGRLIERFSYPSTSGTSGTSLVRFDPDGDWFPQSWISVLPSSPGSSPDGSLWSDFLPRLPEWMNQGIDLPSKLKRKSTTTWILTFPAPRSGGCSIWKSTSVSGPFQEIAVDVRTGRFEDTNSVSHGAFYRVKFGGANSASSSR